MNPEGDEFVALGNIHARRANLIDELRRHAVNAEGNQLVCIQPLEVSRFDFTRELQADVVNGHGPLLFCVDSVEAQRLHFLYVLGIGGKWKTPAPSPSFTNPSHSNRPASRVIVKCAS